MTLAPMLFRRRLARASTRPTDLARPPASVLPCDLLPPGFMRTP